MRHTSREATIIFPINSVGISMTANLHQFPESIYNFIENSYHINDTWNHLLVNSILFIDCGFCWISFNMARYCTANIAYILFMFVVNCVWLRAHQDQNIYLLSVRCLSFCEMQIVWMHLSFRSKWHQSKISMQVCNYDGIAQCCSTIWRAYLKWNNCDAHHPVRRSKRFCIQSNSSANTKTHYVCLTQVTALELLQPENISLLYLFPCYFLFSTLVSIEMLKIICICMHVTFREMYKT